MAEHESETECVEDKTAKAGVDDAFHQHIDGLAGTAKTGLQHGEPDLHAENQEGGDQRPGSVYRIDHVSSFDLGVGSEYISEKNPRDDSNNQQNQTDTQG